MKHKTDAIIFELNYINENFIQVSISTNENDVENSLSN